MLLQLNRKELFIIILKVACCLLFLGRGWQHFFWDAPYRTFFWNESLLEGVVTSFGYSWQEYASSSLVDNALNTLTIIIGAFYFFLAGIIFFLNENRKKLGQFLIAGAASLFILFLLYFVEKQFKVGMLIEHGIQFAAPLMLYVALYKENFFAKYKVFFKVAVAATFIGHGMFAAGIHPVPGAFLDMIITVFGLSESMARVFLLTAGSLDFLAAVLLFIPKTEMFALGFTIGWGLITAFARIVANLNLDLAVLTSHQWLMETLYRLPHGLIPLAIFLYLRNQNKKAV